FHDALSGKRLVFEHAEAAAIESESTRIVEPQGALRPRQSGLLVPDRDLLRADRGLNDGHERRAVLLNRNRLFQLVLEKVAKRLCRRGGLRAGSDGLNARKRQRGRRLQFGELLQPFELYASA